MPGTPRVQQQAQNAAGCRWSPEHGPWSRPPTSRGPTPWPSRHAAADHPGRQARRPARRRRAGHGRQHGLDDHGSRRRSSSAPIPGSTLAMESPPKGIARAGRRPGAVHARRESLLSGAPHRPEVADPARGLPGLPRLLLADPRRPPAGRRRPPPTPARPMPPATTARGRSRRRASTAFVGAIGARSRRAGRGRDPRRLRHLQGRRPHPAGRLQREPLPRHRPARRRARRGPRRLRQLVRRVEGRVDPADLPGRGDSTSRARPRGNPAAELGEGTVVAKPGYVVAGINYRAGLLVDAVQLVFGRVKAGRVDLRDAYTSPWLGDADGGSLMFVSGEGRFIAGVVGRSNGREINGIGLAVAAGPVNAKVGDDPRRPAATRRSPPPGRARPRRRAARRAPGPDRRRPSRPAATSRARAPTVDPLPALDPPAEVDPAAAAAASRRPAPVALRGRLRPEPAGRRPARAIDDPREGFRDVAPAGACWSGSASAWSRRSGATRSGRSSRSTRSAGATCPAVATGPRRSAAARRSWRGRATPSAA